MRVEAVGEPWRPDEAVEAIGRAEWVHVGALLRSDFPLETLAELGRGRRLLLDAQGLVRVPRVGPLALDAEFDRELLRHITVLKLAEEEAAALLGTSTPDEEALLSLGVPEILLTLGSAGCAVFVDGRFEHVPASPVKGEVDPTGAGDAFAVSYVAGRSEGHSPASAARRATALVSGLLGGRMQ
jgi:sugar/nucleoside kinase (ribokinase family)